MPDDTDVRPVAASEQGRRRFRRSIVCRLIAGSSLTASGGAASANAQAVNNPLPWSLTVAVIACAFMAVAAYRRDPHRSLRWLTDLLIHAFYRFDTRGLEHIPAGGPAVLVCNHVSFVDSLVIMAAVRRPIRFVIDHRIYETPLANTLFRHSRTIPIATAKESPTQKEAAFAEVASALRNGELIGLFPEGGITRNGDIDRFRYGVGRIVGETPVPVIPMALRGLWGSFYSRRYGAAMSKPSCLRWRAPIELVAGPAVAPRDVTPEALQQIVGELRGDLR